MQWAKPLPGSLIKRDIVIQIVTVYDIKCDFVEHIRVCLRALPGPGYM